MLCGTRNDSLGDHTAVTDDLDSIYRKDRLGRGVDVHTLRTAAAQQCAGGRTIDAQIQVRAATDKGVALLHSVAPGPIIERSRHVGSRCE